MRSTPMTSIFPRELVDALAVAANEIGLGVDAILDQAHDKTRVPLDTQRRVVIRVAEEPLEREAFDKAAFRAPVPAERDWQR